MVLSVPVQTLPKPGHLFALYLAVDLDGRGSLARGLPVREAAGCDVHVVASCSRLLIEPKACGTAAYDQTCAVQGHEGESVWL